MTTHNFGGFRVTNDGSGVPLSVHGATMGWMTSEFFRFKYAIDTPAAGQFSPITVDLAPPSKLLTVNLTSQGSTSRMFLDDVGAIARYTWVQDGETKVTTVLSVQTDVNQFAYFALAGDALPTITSTSHYNAFVASVTSITSEIGKGQATFGPGSLHNMEKALAYTSTSDDDYIAGVDGVDDWSERPLEAGVGADTVIGTSGTDWVRGGNGNDSLVGADGDDRLYGENGHDMLYGGAGSDSLFGGNGNDLIDGGDNADSLVGGSGDDTIYGGNGADRVRGDTGNDLLFGENGNDNMNGGGGSDTMYGGSGDDTVRGDGGTDLLFGEDGNDVMGGGAGADTIYGGAGDDTMDGGTHADLMYGGDGNDVMNGGSGADVLFGEADDDVLRGSSGNDVLYGGIGNDTLDGGTGHDLLYADAGNNAMNGGAGNDTLVSGLGDDTMTGGKGEDVFVISSVLGDSHITDFLGRDGDRLYISSDLAADVETAMGLATEEGRVVTFDFGAAGTLTLEKTSIALIENFVEIWTVPEDFL
ncbi:Ca2+-binding protein, RTX toxin-related [Gemmobacter megaterium]|uniref:Ca2+-binding protein, RTX toxin-related n=1 Tax=Gemmobacter megaterium TaxID=1086013 RepID=A0A1N7KEV1_9RHOB|nr:calcium-binding protein [Gemmobacter megaterium]GGE01746.1 hypothetical protein GCM10011345_03780 [Gemmobacter megaterium]SIS60095.1 Ca2+-binding protein, RTX toxin-related [Gemmobacter megaterium]